MKTPRPSWPWRFATKHPALALSMCYLAACGMGTLALSARLYRFGLRVFDVAGTTDVFTAGISSIGIFTLIMIPLCGWIWLRLETGSSMRGRWTMAIANGSLAVLGVSYLLGTDDGIALYSPRVSVSYVEGTVNSGRLIASTSQAAVVLPADDPQAGKAIVIPIGQLGAIHSLEVRPNEFWQLPLLVVAIGAAFAGLTALIAKLSARLT